MEHHIERILARYKDEDENIFFEHVKKCVAEESCSKPKIIARLIEIFSQKYISKNVWLMEEFYKIACHLFMAKGGKAGKEEELLQHIANCMLLFKTLGRRKVDLRGVRGSIDDVHRIIYRYDGKNAYTCLEDLRDKVSENIFALMHFVYNCWITGQHYEDMLIALTHMCNLAPKERKIDKDGTELCDYVWMRLVELATRLDDGHNDLIFRFIRIGKELFYYKLTKKNSMERINLLYFCCLVMAQKDVKYDEVEYVKIVMGCGSEDGARGSRGGGGGGGEGASGGGRKKKIVDNKHSSGDCDYLFVILDYDNDVILEVKNDIERHVKYNFHEQTKRINSHELSRLQRPSINIIKRNEI